jgi:glycosyltransferase involved in cell wall biosynthesis
MNAAKQSRRAQPPKIIAVLGRRDSPTDGVVDYCDFLREALGRQGVSLETYAVPWVQRGWVFSLYGLWKQSKVWRGKWTVLQYTALSWSKRGFPFVTLPILWILRLQGVRRAVVFHDAFVHPSDRLINRIRDRIQNWIMARLYNYCDQPILTAPAATLCWIPRGRRRAAFIPIGANIPEVDTPRAFDTTQFPKIVSVFSVTGGVAQAQEVQDIVQAVTHAGNCVGPIRLEVFGRGSQEAHDLLDHGLTGANVELRVHGVIPAPTISQIVSKSHVVLNVRGLTTSRRGTSIAGIACAIPVVGYGYPGTDPPIDAAGVLLAPWRNPQFLGNLLVQLLKDPTLWNELHERSQHAQAEYFSWSAVARRYREALSSSLSSQSRTSKYRVLILRDHPTPGHASFLQRKAQHPKLDILVAYRRLTADSPAQPTAGPAQANTWPKGTSNNALLQGYAWILIPANGNANNGSSRAALKSKAVRQLTQKAVFDAICVNDGPISSGWNVILRGKDSPIIVPARSHNGHSGKSRSPVENTQNLDKDVESFVHAVESAVLRTRVSAN